MPHKKDTEYVLTVCKRLLTYDKAENLFRWRRDRRGGPKAGDPAAHVSAGGARRLRVAGLDLPEAEFAHLWLHREWPQKAPRPSKPPPAPKYPGVVWKPRSGWWARTKGKRGEIKKAGPFVDAADAYVAYLKLRATHTKLIVHAQAAIKRLTEFTADRSSARS